MIKPRHQYNATDFEISVTADGEAIAITFRTDAEIDLTVSLHGDRAKRLRDQIDALSA